jgi:polyphosphate glucokinase
MKRRRPRVLVIDVGGTHVKLLATGKRAHREFDSGPHLTPRQMVAGVLKLSADWPTELVSIGLPGPVQHGKSVAEPVNLGPGWVGFDFARAFNRPVRLVNDAAMQALGSYTGGRMLFLGLGTGMGSAMVVDGVLQPTELAHLPYEKGKTFEDYVGLRGFRRLGKKRWRATVRDVVAKLTAALQVDYVVLGGGNARHMKSLPPKTRLGNNDNAFRGGFELWKDR